MTVAADRSSLPDAFSVVVTGGPEEVTVALHGELDLSGIDTFVQATNVLRPSAGLIVDLRDLSFIDSTGIRTLMGLDVRARAEGWTLTLSAPQRAVRRVLTLCQFDRRVTIDE